MTRKEGLCNKNCFVCQDGKFWEVNVLVGNYIGLGLNSSIHICGLQRPALDKGVYGRECLNLRVYVLKLMPFISNRVADAAIESASFYGHFLSGSEK